MFRTSNFPTTYLSGQRVPSDLPEHASQDISAARLALPTPNQTS